MNPADGAVFLATRTRLFRVVPGARRAEPVGDRQDTMGFTVVGPDCFLGSGHPDLRDWSPPLLGLIRSGRCGPILGTVSLPGEADVHVLRARRADVYAADAVSGRLLASGGGRLGELVGSADGRRWTPGAGPAA